MLCMSCQCTYQETLSGERSLQGLADVPIMKKTAWFRGNGMWRISCILNFSSHSLLLFSVRSITIHRSVNKDHPVTWAQLNLQAYWHLYAASYWSTPVLVILSVAHSVLNMEEWSEPINFNTIGLQMVCRSLQSSFISSIFHRHGDGRLMR